MFVFAYNAEFAKTAAACENTAAEMTCASSYRPFFGKDTSKVSLFAFLNGLSVRVLDLLLGAVHQPNVSAFSKGKAVAD